MATQLTVVCPFPQPAEEHGRGCAPGGGRADTAARVGDCQRARSTHHLLTVWLAACPPASKHALLIKHAALGYNSAPRSLAKRWWCSPTTNTHAEACLTRSCRTCSSMDRPAPERRRPRWQSRGSCSGAPAPRSMRFRCGVGTKACKAACTPCVCVCVFIRRFTASHRLALPARRTGQVAAGTAVLGGACCVLEPRACR